MGTGEAKETYKERTSTAECVNANLRRFRLTCFPLRGLKKTLPPSLHGIYIRSHPLMAVVGGKKLPLPSPPQCRSLRTLGGAGIPWS